MLIRNMSRHSVLLYQQYKYLKACVRCVYQLWKQLSTEDIVVINMAWIETVRRRKAKLQHLTSHVSTGDNDKVDVDISHPLLTLVKDRELIHLKLLISRCLHDESGPRRSTVVSILDQLGLESFSAKSSVIQFDLWTRHQRLCSLIDGYTSDLPPRLMPTSFSDHINEVPRQTRAPAFERKRNFCDIDKQNIICHTQKRRRKAIRAYKP